MNLRLCKSELASSAHHHSLVADMHSLIRGHSLRLLMTCHLARNWLVLPLKLLEIN
jgi:hypothetical protein